MIALDYTQSIWADRLAVLYTDSKQIPSHADRICHFLFYEIVNYNVVHVDSLKTTSKAWHQVMQP